eukprot:494586_1
MGNKQPTVTSMEDNDAFIIKFNRNNTINDALCQKRVIFISFIGLCQSYRKCPPHILYSSLLIMPLKKEWIQYPSQYMELLRSASSGLVRNDADGQDLFELLKWKDSQGLVIWTQDEYQTSQQSSILVHPFWQFVSDILVSLYDPITSQCYKPLILDVDNVSYKSDKIKMSDILTELYFKPLSYASMKTILNASNPDSFRVVTSYNDAVIPPIEFVKTLVDDCDEWYIASDY